MPPDSFVWPFAQMTGDRRSFQPRKHSWRASQLTAVNTWD